VDRGEFLEEWLTFHGFLMPRSIPEWEEYYGSMPWLSLPEGTAGATSQIKNNLAQKLQIRGIPTLIVLDVKTGKFVTANARDDVSKVAGDNDKGLETIAAWKAVEPVPIEEANFNQGGGGPGGIMGIIFYILKNPIYIFGMLYFWKKLVRYLQQAGGAGGSIEPEDVPPMENQDTEF
jgi:nucleoredoxin